MYYQTNPHLANNPPTSDTAIPKFLDSWDASLYSINVQFILHICFLLVFTFTPSENDPLEAVETGDSVISEVLAMQSIRT